jgi:hypothetical protein
LLHVCAALLYHVTMRERELLEAGQLVVVFLERLDLPLLGDDAHILVLHLVRFVTMVHAL